MTLDAALITKIDTPVVGANGPTVLGFGTPGIDAVAVTNDVTGDSLFDPSAPLSLTPETEGGMGSYGQNGDSFGQAGSPRCCGTGCARVRRSRGRRTPQYIAKAWLDSEQSGC